MAYIAKVVGRGGAVKWKVAVFISGDGGRQRRVWNRFATQAEAKVWASRMTLEKANGNPTPDAKLTLGTFLTKWLADHEPGLAKTSIVRYKELANGIILPALTSVKLSKLNPQIITSFYADQAKAGKSGSTMQMVHNLLNHCLKDATRAGLLFRNPCSPEHVDAPKRSDFEAVVWDYEQCRLFLAESKRSSRYHGLWLFLLSTGAREGEALGLRWSDVDFTYNEVHIRQKLYRLGRTLLVGKPKTKNGTRTLPLTPALVGELKRIKVDQETRRKEMGAIYDPSGLNLVFTDLHGHPLWIRNIILKHFRPLCQRAGVPVCRAHDLRHACASYLVAQGVDPNTVSKILGHATASFTMDKYVSSVNGDQQKRDAMARLEHLFQTNAREG